MTWSSWHTQLQKTLIERDLLPKNQGILIAVSGGQDSLCLAQLLLDLQPIWGWKLGISHCDHGWRIDSQDNANYVQNLAIQWQLPFYLATTKILIKNEANARTWRYQSLLEFASSLQYNYVVTGHTASDRAETLLHNLMRGSGSDGLQSLTWRRNLSTEIQLVRPLLEFTRTETSQFCQAHHLSIWEDSTNQDLKYTRNRIRHELLPYLQENFNPQVELHLSQTAEIIYAEVDYLETLTTDLLQRCEIKENRGENVGMINRIILREIPLALQRRVWRKFIQTHLDFSPNFAQIEKLIRLIYAPNRSRTDPLLRGIIAEVSHDYICLRFLDSIPQN